MRHPSQQRCGRAKDCPPARCQSWFDRHMMECAWRIMAKLMGFSGPSACTTLQIRLLRHSMDPFDFRQEFRAVKRRPTSAWLASCYKRTFAHSRSSKRKMLVCEEADGLPLKSGVSFDNGAQLKRLWSLKSEFTFV